MSFEAFDTVSKWQKYNEDLKGRRMYGVRGSLTFATSKKMEKHELQVNEDLNKKFV